MGSTYRPERRSPASGWLAGLVLGAASGFGVLELGVFGTVLLLASILVIAWKGPCLVAAGGLVTGCGALWTALLSRVALTCGAGAFFPDPSCSTNDLTAWVTGSAAILVIGLVVSAAGLRRARR